MVQTDLTGKTIPELEESINKCLTDKERKTSLKTTYPGRYFSITISDKENDALDEIVEPMKQRAFITKKMKPRETLPLNSEGIAYQTDIELFMGVLFITGKEHMSPETYERLMAERKPEGEPQQRLDAPKPKERKKKGKQSVVDGLKEKFGAENVKVEQA